MMGKFCQAVERPLHCRRAVNTLPTSRWAPSTLPLSYWVPSTLPSIHHLQSLSLQAVKHAPHCYQAPSACFQVIECPPHCRPLHCRCPPHCQQAVEHAPHCCQAVKHPPLFHQVIDRHCATIHHHSTGSIHRHCFASSCLQHTLPFPGDSTLLLKKFKEAQCAYAPSSTTIVGSSIILTGRLLGSSFQN